MKNTKLFGGTKPFIPKGFEVVKNYNIMRKLYTQKKRCRIDACKPGLALYGDTLIMITDYYRADRRSCYIVSTGSSFLGNIGDPPVGELLVHPVTVS